MKRRNFIRLLGVACATLASGAVAQTPGTVYRVGFVNPGNPEADPNRFVASLLQGLARRGYELDRNLLVTRTARFVAANVRPSSRVRESERVRSSHSHRSVGGLRPLLHRGHAGPGFVLAQCLEQAILALVCEPRHVFLSGKIGSMAAA